MVSEKSVLACAAHSSLPYRILSSLNNHKSSREVGIQKQTITLLRFVEGMDHNDPDKVLRLKHQPEETNALWIYTQHHSAEAPQTLGHLL